jgi:hypothetical protein
VLQTLEGVRVDYNPETGYIFIRWSGYVHVVKLNYEENDVFCCLYRLNDAERTTTDAKSAGAKRGVDQRRAKAAGA